MSAIAKKFIGRMSNDTSSGSTLQLKYLVQCDALTDTTNTAKAYILAIGTPPGYVTESCEANGRDRNPFWYEVVWTMHKSWSLLVSENPLDRPSIMTGSWDEWEEAYFIDADGKKVVNSFGDRFDPLPKRRNGRMVLQITKNFATFDAVAYEHIRFTTNTSAITIRGVTYPARSLLFHPPTCQENYEQIGETTYHYFAVTFRLVADEDLHIDTFDDRGLYEFGYEAGVGDTGRVPILDDAGLPVHVAVQLDGTGHKAVPNESGVMPAIEHLDFKAYPDAEWGIDFS